MPSFVLVDSAGTRLVVSIPKSLLVRRLGLLEALAADEAASEVRMSDVGYGELSVSEFALAVHIAYTSSPAEALFLAGMVLGDVHAPSILGAVEWLGVGTSSAMVKSVRLGDELLLASSDTSLPPDPILCPGTGSKSRVKAILDAVPLSSFEDALVCGMSGSDRRRQSARLSKSLLLAAGRGDSFAAACTAGVAKFDFVEPKRSFTYACRCRVGLASCLC